MKNKIPGIVEKFQKKTGLKFDSYFSGAKIRWILDNVDSARERAEKGKLCFGTVDNWLIYKLSKDKVHVTDCSNASRTLLFNINTLELDEELCEFLDYPCACYLK